MPSPRAPDFAADIAAFGAVSLIVALAAATWAGGGLVRPGPRGAGSELTKGKGGELGAAETLPPALSKAAAAKRPTTFNVILITIDTLRVDLGFMGYPRPVSPNIDALAAKSVVYE